MCCAPTTSPYARTRHRVRGSARRRSAGCARQSHGAADAGRTSWPTPDLHALNRTAAWPARHCSASAGSMVPATGPMGASACHELQAVEIREPWMQNDGNARFGRGSLTAPINPGEDMPPASTARSAKSDTLELLDRLRAPIDLHPASSHRALPDESRKVATSSASRSPRISPCACPERNGSAKDWVKRAANLDEAVTEQTALLRDFQAHVADKATVAPVGSLRAAA